MYRKDQHALVPQLKKDDLNLEYYDRYVKPFTVDELDCLLATIHVPSVRQMVKFLAWTGLRHGELKALAWEDVDLENKRITVKYNLTRKGKLKPPKNQKRLPCGRASSSNISGARRNEG